jgi:hypothetical protein
MFILTLSSLLYEYYQMQLYHIHPPYTSRVLSAVLMGYDYL